MKLDVTCIEAPGVGKLRITHKVLGLARDDVSQVDLNRIIETEALLERLTGHRWHISEGE